MFYQVIHLQNFFPQLGTESIDPTLTAYLPDNLTEMGRLDQKHPCLLICPGGGYAMCSQRESAPIAYHFLPEGYNVFVLEYSAAPEVAHRGSFENLLGHAALNSEEIKRFSCHLQVTGHTPPAFLWHTATDPVVPVGNSLLYSEALMSHQIPLELHVYPAGGHGLATVDEQTNDHLEAAVTHAADWIEAAKKWLRILFF